MQVKLLRLFISCPGDCHSYKKAVLELIKESDLVHGTKQRVRIEGYTFENMLPEFDSDGAQAVINQNNFGHVDIFLGLMWTRFGAPTAGFGSGTEEEYVRAIEWHKVNQKPAYVLFGFSDEKCSPSTIDPDQLKKVVEFRRNIGKTQLYSTWKTKTELKTRFRNHLNKIIADEADNPNNFVLGGAIYN